MTLLAMTLLVLQIIFLIKYYVSTIICIEFFMNDLFVADTCENSQILKLTIAYTYSLKKEHIATQKRKEQLNVIL